ncbi:MAG: hypothetical protein AAGF07_04030 [Patescibacteria group bacterium]
MTKQFPRLINIIGTVSLIVIIFVVGFYFGYKNATASQANLNGIPVTTASDTPNNKQEIKALEVLGVQWIKIGQEPVCESNYPIKGTFADNFGNYYTPENSRYKRIKADICFANEEYARDTAGFVKKY